MLTGKSVTKKREISADMDIAIAIAAMEAVIIIIGAMMVHMEGTNHVEIYQTILIFCGYCRTIYGWGGADGFDSAGDHEPDCR